MNGLRDLRRFFSSPFLYIKVQHQLRKMQLQEPQQLPQSLNPTGPLGKRIAR